MRERAITELNKCPLPYVTGSYIPHHIGRRRGEPESTGKEVMAGIAVQAKGKAGTPRGVKRRLSARSLRAGASPSAKYTPGQPGKSQ